MDGDQGLWFPAFGLVQCQPGLGHRPAGWPDSNRASAYCASSLLLEASLENCWLLGAWISEGRRRQQGLEASRAEAHGMQFIAVQKRSLIRSVSHGFWLLA